MHILFESGYKLTCNLIHTCTGRKESRERHTYVHTSICDATPLLGQLSDSGVSEHTRHEPRPKPIGDERHNVAVAQRGQHFLVGGEGVQRSLVSIILSEEGVHLFLTS